jgi:hypothetical protein
LNRLFADLMVAKLFSDTDILRPWFKRIETQWGSARSPFFCGAVLAIIRPDASQQRKCSDSQLMLF